MGGASTGHAMEGASTGTAMEGASTVAAMEGERLGSRTGRRRRLKRAGGKVVVVLCGFGGGEGRGRLTAAYNGVEWRRGAPRGRLL
jgi:hypothetical protein